MAVIAVLVIISILIVEVEGGNHGRSGSNIGSNSSSNNSSNISGCYSSVSHHINTNSGSGRRKSW